MWFSSFPLRMQLSTKQLTFSVLFRVLPEAVLHTLEPARQANFVSGAVLSVLSILSAYLSTQSIPFGSCSEKTKQLNASRNCSPQDPCWTKTR
jgi:hypothetical protein